MEVSLVPVLVLSFCGSPWRCGPFWRLQICALDTGSPGSYAVSYNGQGIDIGSHWVTGDSTKDAEHSSNSSSYSLNPLFSFWGCLYGPYLLSSCGPPSLIALPTSDAWLFLESLGGDFPWPYFIYRFLSLDQLCSQLIVVTGYGCGTLVA